MIEFLTIAFSLVLGIGLGIFYFGGLWLTIRHLFSSKNPGTLILASFLGRSVAFLFGFYLVAGIGLKGFAASLIGFTLTKIVLTHRWGILHTGGEILDRD